MKKYGILGENPFFWFLYLNSTKNTSKVPQLFSVQQNILTQTRTELMKQHPEFCSQFGVVTIFYLFFISKFRWIAGPTEACPLGTNF